MPSNRGMTLIEVVLASSLMALLLLGLATWFRSSHRALERSVSRDQLFLEATTVADFLSRTLNRAQGATVRIGSSSWAPWSRLEVADRSHHYTLYGEATTLRLIADQQEVRDLTRHLAEIQFSADEDHVPTLLRWRFRLAAGPDGTGDTVERSGVAYLAEEAP